MAMFWSLCMCQCRLLGLTSLEGNIVMSLLPSRVRLKAQAQLRQHLDEGLRMCMQIVKDLLFNRAITSEGGPSKASGSAVLGEVAPMEP